ncbi:hypothetical protein HU200_057758 [Digitaria exilis]|uniref:Fe2OG dioxygenase domain-containing protein n=1 Tax=Digitaria exilis TaxID=1010633 RepID=A0A835AK89_9POAL|nr:hypothetical protein HU200_057758 [Digitaria exilis]
MAATVALPVVDLAPFLAGDDKADGVAGATETVREACRTHGFFRAVNHGVPTELMARALQLSAAFFALPDEEKAKARPADGSGAPLPAGYSRRPANSTDKSEYMLVFNPKFGFNAYPADPAGFREAVDECFTKLTELGLLVQEILNECMGLPPGFLRDFNDDRSFDFMLALRYFPATEEESNGLSAHEDGNCITFVIQDDVGGLEVLKDGVWIPVEPIDGSIIVNIGDVTQVLSNNKLKSATHRVVMRKPVHRHSLAFYFNIHGDKWIEPGDHRETMAATVAIPVVDLAPFLAGDDKADGVAGATETVREACRTHGFFRAVNHGVPTELMARALKLSAAFFALPDEEKAKARPADGSEAPFPVGYTRRPAHSPDKSEFLLVLDPKLGFNTYPAEPGGFREAVDECFAKLTELGLLVQEILNECMGLPPGFLRDFNGERSSDFMVLSNKKLKSATHRVVMRKPVHRHSLAFSLSIHGDKWIEPLPEFTAKVGEAPRYRGFVLREYQQLRSRRNKTHPSFRPEDMVQISITHYAI